MNVVKLNIMARKIFFLIPYPLNHAPSQRFRFEQYLELLHQHGYRFKVQSFLNSDNRSLFYQPGNWLSKILIILKGFVKRATILFEIGSSDYTFIHREATPLGPPVIEWLVAKVCRSKIIYDFDDAIWLTDRQKESRLLRLLKWRSKVSSICRWSYKISCGNDYLVLYAKHFNHSAFFLPSTIDTVNVHNPKHYASPRDRSMIQIGWTGSHSTLKYLSEIEPVIQRLENEYSNIKFTVIADRMPNLKLKRLTFIKWSAASEISDLMNLDIGVMPLPDDDWSQGKCGFKLLQYMALEIPAVASSVGANKKIVHHNRNGFLCTTHEEWYVALRTLIEDKNLREKLGREGRDFVKKHYSVNSNAGAFLSLFK